MPMNLVIQEKRKELGLTQEQVAEYLNVSIPAVSKWEKGSTSPDISLLAPLARLLKIDLNTLFCFQEDMSQEEIGYFCREVAALIQSKGIAAGFEAAAQKIHRWPNRSKSRPNTPVTLTVSRTRSPGCAPVKTPSCLWISITWGFPACRRKSRTS